MSAIDISAFFSKDHLQQLNKYSKGSSEWSNTLDSISDNIKNLDDLISGLRSLPTRIKTDNFTYLFEDKNKNQRLFLEEDLRPVIELSLDRRLEVYEDLPNLIENLNITFSEEDKKTQNSDKTNLLQLLKNTILSTKESVSQVSNLDSITEKLKKLKESQPTEDLGLKSKIEWLKDIASTLASLNFMDSVLKSIQSEIPKFWNQLTFRQKLQVSAIAPIIGAGAVIGGVGIAGMGNAVGVPAIIVVLILLLLTNGIIDFLDFIINFLSDGKKTNIDYETAKETFNKIFEGALSDLFKSDFNFENVRNSDNFESTGDKPRDYEFYTVSKLAKELNGEGFVTSQSKDFGIDGYIINQNQNEIVLIQSKLYTNKVGFGDATKYLGTLKYWQKRFLNKFKYPITKMIICSQNDFSIEAKELAKLFPEEIELKVIT